MNTHVMGWKRIIGFTLLLSSQALSAHAQTPGTPRAACAVQAPDGGSVPNQDLALVHRFDLPEKLAWGKVSIRLDSPGWRVGGIDGPRPNAAQTTSSDA